MSVSLCLYPLAPSHCTLWDGRIEQGSRRKKPDDRSDSLRADGVDSVVASIEESTTEDIIKLFTSAQPDAVVWSAGAGGKGPAERTEKVDYEGALKVFDAMENSNVHRLLYVGAADTRDMSKPPPSYYNEESSERLPCPTLTMPT